MGPESVFLGPEARTVLDGGVLRGVTRVPGAAEGKPPVLDLQDCRDLKVENP